MHDIHNYPGPAAPPIEKKRAIVLGEFGGLGLPVEGHLWQDDKNWGYQNMAVEGRADRPLRPPARPALAAARRDGPVRRRLHADDRRRGRGQRPPHLRPRGDEDGRSAHARGEPRQGAARRRRRRSIKTAQDEPAEWKYTTEKPADGWEKPEFDDSTWKTGKSGFGTEGTPGAIVNTTWNTPDIWLRREIEIPADAIKDAEFVWHHDEAAQVFINGVLAAAQRPAHDRLRRAAHAATKAARR